MTSTIFVLRCMKCDTKANDKDNPTDFETIKKARKANNSYNGWLCKCGHYNGLDK